MQINFKLSERLAGFAVSVNRAANMVDVVHRELVAPTEPILLADRLERFQGVLFSKIPNLPRPAFIENLLIIIQPDFSGTAYVNELKITMQVRTSRAVKAGDPVYVSDVTDIKAVDLGVNIPDDVGIVIVRSFGWKRSLFYDLGPILPEVGPRQYSLDTVLAQQELLLMGISTSGLSIDGVVETRVGHMLAGLDKLKVLLKQKVDVEASYQELLEEHPWMLGGQYSEVRRHAKLDDARIPDFTALRCYDKFNDIIEIKQPFLRLFREDGGFTSDFNDAWNQSEGYLAFVIRQRQYLRDEKQLYFENPRCLLIAGFSLSESELAKLREKQTFAHSISIFTYDHLLETAEHIFNLARTAHERVVPMDTNSDVG